MGQVCGLTVERVTQADVWHSLSRVDVAFGARDLFGLSAYGGTEWSRGTDGNLRDEAARQRRCCRPQTERLWRTGSQGRGLVDMPFQC